MPTRNLDAVFYVSQPPTLELVDGLFHVCFNISDSCRLQVVMPPRAYFTALRASNRLAGDFEDGERNTVVPLHPVREDVGHA